MSDLPFCFSACIAHLTELSQSPVPTAVGGRNLWVQVLEVVEVACCARSRRGDLVNASQGARNLAHHAVTHDHFRCGVCLLLLGVQGPQRELSRRAPHRTPKTYHHQVRKRGDADDGSLQRKDPVVAKELLRYLEAQYRWIIDMQKPHKGCRERDGDGLQIVHEQVYRSWW
jgi:hypothetical protein